MTEPSCDHDFQPYQPDPECVSDERFWRCSKCGEPGYLVPDGLLERLDA